MLLGTHEDGDVITLTTAHLTCTRPWQQTERFDPMAPTVRTSVHVPVNRRHQS
jgi:hypothetical protein